MHHHREQVAGTCNERGASLVEYAMLMALITAVCIGAVTFFGQAVDTKTGQNSACIGTAMGVAGGGTCTTP